MSTYEERRLDVLAARLRARTQADGSPMRGYAENVAAIRAEIETLTLAEEKVARRGKNSDN